MSDQPKSLAAAWGAHRQNSKVRATPQVSMEVQEESRPESLADAILAKRRAALEPSDKELVDSIEEPLEAAEEPEEDISHQEEPLPFPTSRADAIRRKLKALRE